MLRNAIILIIVLGATSTAWVTFNRTESLLNQGEQARAEAYRSLQEQLAPYLLIEQPTESEQATIAHLQMLMARFEPDPNDSPLTAFKTEWLLWGFAFALVMLGYGMTRTVHYQWPDVPTPEIQSPSLTIRDDSMLAMNINTHVLKPSADGTWALVPSNGLYCIMAGLLLTVAAAYLSVGFPTEPAHLTSGLLFLVPLLITGYIGFRLARKTRIGREFDRLIIAGQPVGRSALLGVRQVTRIAGRDRLILSYQIQMVMYDGKARTVALLTDEQDAAQMTRTMAGLFQRPILL